VTQVHHVSNYQHLLICHKWFWLNNIEQITLLFLPRIAFITIVLLPYFHLREILPNFLKIGYTRTSYVIIEFNPLKKCVISVARGCLIKYLDTYALNFLIELVKRGVHEIKKSDNFFAIKNLLVILLCVSMDHWRFFCCLYLSIIAVSFLSIVFFCTIYIALFFKYVFCVFIRVWMTFFPGYGNTLFEFIISIACWCCDFFPKWKMTYFLILWQKFYVVLLPM